MDAIALMPVNDTDDGRRAAGTAGDHVPYFFDSVANAVARGTACNLTPVDRGRLYAVMAHHCVGPCGLETYYYQLGPGQTLQLGHGALGAAAGGGDGSSRPQLAGGGHVSGWEVGSEWRHVGYDDPSEVAVAGKVLVSDRPRKLELTWASPWRSELVSTVTFDIEEQFGAVKLTVTHVDLPAEGSEMLEQGWPAILSSLKTSLETGQPMPGTTRRWGGAKPSASARG